MASFLRRAEGLFRALHESTIGPRPDLSAFRPEAHPPALLEQARRVWQDRAQTEFRSIQIMNRFLSEVLAAGDPLDVYAGALELVRDEIRHTELCAAVCDALGVRPQLPDPLALDDPEAFLRSPMPERALATAITMLAISETLSVAFITDLAQRCADPSIRWVLEQTIADEAEHQDFGWSYVERSLSRFPPSSLRDWRHLAQTTLAPHRKRVDELLGSLEPARRTLEAWPEPELAALGLFSPQRQALVCQKALTETLQPRLAAVGLG